MTDRLKRFTLPWFSSTPKASDAISIYDNDGTRICTVAGKNWQPEVLEQISKLVAEAPNLARVLGEVKAVLEFGVLNQQKATGGPTKKAEKAERDLLKMIAGALDKAGVK